MDSTKSIKSTKFATQKTPRASTQSAKTVPEKASATKTVTDNIQAGQKVVILLNFYPSSGRISTPELWQNDKRILFEEKQFERETKSTTQVLEIPTNATYEELKEGIRSLAKVEDKEFGVLDKHLAVVLKGKEALDLVLEG